MIKQFAVSAVIAGAVILPVSAASAAGGDPAACANFSRPVIIGQGYDPLHLDTDHDGIACEHNPGDPVKTDLYADLRGEGDSNPQPSLSPSAAPTLAHTGAVEVIQRHPLRMIAASAVLVGVGAGLVLVRRRTN